MSQAPPNPPKPVPGGRTFRYVQENWSDLDKLERIGLSLLVIILANKNRIEKSIKRAFLSIIFPSKRAQKH